ncbi:MAG: 3-carboxy-cis,cis-muconate cycloisomerase [Kiloniellales bacterium]
MTVSPLDSALYGALLSDAETAALFDDRADMRAMLAVEAALARAEAKLGIIPAEAAERIARTAENLEIEPATLAAGTASAGVPVPALVESLRQAAGGEAAAYVHWGATSQDIIDSALLLRLRSALEIHERRLAALIEQLAALAEAHRATVMAGRTRSQQATPITFGLKVAGWLAPLLRQRARLNEIRPRLLLVSFGGAAGTLAALGERGLEVAEALAGELALGMPPGPWHSQRDGLAELGGWLALTTGALGKIGQDVALLAQSEVSELHEGAGGGSSTMPQKANPVASETLVTAARMNAGLLATLHQAMLPEHERGGVAWQLEWLTLPQMVVLTGAALRQAVALIGGLQVDVRRMRANLDASNGLILAEAASFALARHMPRPEAQALVKAACRDAIAQQRHLIDLLAERVDAPLDWQTLRDPANYLGAAGEIVDRILRDARSGKS